MVFLVAVHYSYFSQVENILDHCHFHHEAFPVMELDKIMVECLLTSCPYSSSTQEKTRVVGCRAVLCILTWAYIPIRQPGQLLAESLVQGHASCVFILLSGSCKSLS